MENRSAEPTFSEIDFRERVSRALLERVGPTKGMTFKQLAYVIQVSEQTIWSWAKAENAPRGWQLMKLLQFFDAAFANEIAAGTGCTVVKLNADRRQELLDALAVLARATA